MKKGKTYLLLSIVIIVWGFLGYRIYSSFYDDEDSMIVNKTNFTKQPRKNSPKEKLEIEYPNRDPFLGKIYKPKPKESTKRKIPVKKSYDSIFRNIRYKGFIKNKTDDSPLYLISYRQRSYVLKLKDEFENIMLLGGTPNEIKVKYKTETKTIRLEN